MNSLTEKNALLTYTKDTMHVQSTTNNYPTAEGSATPNTKNLEKVWSPNKFNQKKPELITLALDNPLKISWGCLKQPSTPMDGNKTKTKQHTSSSIHGPPSPTSSTSSSATCSDTDQPIVLRHTSPPIHHNISIANDHNAANDDAISPGSGGPLSPMHHARRPMNAFLIFCKKHRPVVRRKFLTLENRAVTKILGEWWALLEVDEKEAYTTLAKEYKDAFFNANPNFKWYKLPAPPLRTLHTRPTTSSLLLQQQLSTNNNSNSTTATLSTTMAGILNSYNTITGCTSTTPTCTDKEKSFASCPQGGATAAAATHKESSGGGRVEFTPGKLADESQLGKLSSLLNMSNNNIHMENSNYYSHNNNNYNTENNNNNTTYTSINDASAVNTPVTKQYDSHSPIKPIKKREIVTNDNQNDSLSRMFDSFDGTSNRIFDTSIRLSDNPFRANDIFAGSRVSVDGSRVARSLFDDEEADGLEERKVGRKCKGQRYKEFMIHGKLLKNKRDKLFEDDGDEFLQMDCNSQDNSCMRPHHIDLDTTIKMLAERTRTKLPEFPHRHQSGNAAPSDYIGSLIQDSGVAAVHTSSNNENTNHGNNAFNLDDRIAMLPCLSYEQYVRRKRDSKKRSKFVRNRSQSASEMTGKCMEKSAIATMAPVASVAGLVGSRKRKNKQNITHLQGKNVKEFAVKENAKEDNFAEKGEEVNVAPDLFGLATLAEIAANTEKLNQ